MRYHERVIMLSVLDSLWKDHLLAMDHLKEGIGLRGYAQQDPLVAYKKESFEMFEAMMLRFQEDTLRTLFRMQIIGPDGTPIETPEQMAALRPAAPPELEAAGASSVENAAQIPQTMRDIPIPTRPPQTTIDELEREFQRRKERELNAARQAGGDSSAEPAAPRRAGEKVGRNDLCPCGSGKKYKKCHGAEA
jgi:preprotein translocase subunit SecA